MDEAHSQGCFSKITQAVCYFNKNVLTIKKKGTSGLDLGSVNVYKH